MKIYQEITEWDEKEYSVPNHVYLMDGDKVYAYSKQGKETPHYFKTFLRINRRGRKFIEIKKNKWKFDLTIRTESELSENPKGQTWSVASSKGGEYTVSLDAGRWSCTCPGHGFRGRCRHVDELQASNPQQG